MLKNMKNRKGVYVVISILLVIGLVSFIKLQWFTFVPRVIDNDHFIDTITPTTDATWVTLEGGNTEENIIDASALVVRGKVISQTVTKVDDNNGGIYFTVSKIIVSEVLAKSSTTDDALPTNEKSEVIVSVTQTGAIVDGDAKNIITDAPLLENGKTYVLFLDEFGDGTFVPIAGRLGVAEVVKGELEFTNPEAQEAMISFEGEKLDNVTEGLQQYEDDISNTLVVNENNIPAKEFLLE